MPARAARESAESLPGQASPQRRRSSGSEESMSRRASERRLSGRRNSLLETIGALDKLQGDAAAPAPLVRRRSSFAIADVRREVLDRLAPPPDPDFEELGFSPAHRALVRRCLDVRNSSGFKTSVTLVIFLAGVVVGVQTYPLSAQTEADLAIVDALILAVFCFEVLLKLVAEGKEPDNYFRDGWNAFDFFIVVASLLPFESGAVTILRLIRLLRVLKLVRALPQLRILVIGLLKSLSSIAYIGLLLLLLFYLYAVLGVSLFGANDPDGLGTLHIALVTLFRCATLEDWTDVMYTAMYGCDEYGYDDCDHPDAFGAPAALFFVSFILLSNMMILNLFIGVITSSMSEAKADLTAEMEAEAQEGAAGAGAYQKFVEQRLEEIVEVVLVIAEELDQYAVRDEERRFTEKLARKKKAVAAFAAASPAPGAARDLPPDSPSAAGGANPAFRTASNLARMFDRIRGSPSTPRSSGREEQLTAADGSVNLAAADALVGPGVGPGAATPAASRWAAATAAVASTPPARSSSSSAAVVPLASDPSDDERHERDPDVPRAALYMRGPPLFVDVHNVKSGQRESRPVSPLPQPEPPSPSRPESSHSHGSLQSTDLEEVQRFLDE